MSNVRIKTTGFKVQVLGKDGDRPLIDGYAAIFSNVDLDNEVILPGAFQQFIKTGAQLSIYNTHAWALDNPTALPIGRTRLLQEDKKGLYFKAVLGRTRDGLEVAELMDIEAIQGASFGFEVLPGGEETRNGITYLKALWPKEISVTAMGAANPKASVRLLNKPETEVSAVELFAAVLRGLEQSLNEG